MTRGYHHLPKNRLIRRSVKIPICTKGLMAASSTEAEPDMTRPNEAVDRPKITSPFLPLVWNVLTCFNTRCSEVNCHAQNVDGVPCPALFQKATLNASFLLTPFNSLPTLLVDLGWLLCLVEPRLAWWVFWSSCSIGWPGTLATGIL